MPGRLLALLVCLWLASSASADVVPLLDPGGGSYAQPRADLKPLRGGLAGWLYGAALVDAESWWDAQGAPNLDDCHTDRSSPRAVSLWLGSIGASRGASYVPGACAVIFNRAAARENVRELSRYASRPPSIDNWRSDAIWRLVIIDADAYHESGHWRLMMTVNPLAADPWHLPATADNVMASDANEEHAPGQAWSWAFHVERVLRSMPRFRAARARARAPR